MPRWNLPLVNLCLVISVVIIVCLVISLSVVAATRHTVTPSTANLQNQTATPATAAPQSQTITPLNCSISPEWATNVTAYENADTDNKVHEWWENVSSTQHDRFDVELFKNFGARSAQVECGLQDSNNCQFPGCAGR